MIKTMAFTKTSEVLTDVPIERLSGDDISWFWVDMESADEAETDILKLYFKFHFLSIEDCLERLERPKIDYYDTYNFLVLYAMKEDGIEPIELDVFWSDNYLVTYCKCALKEMDSIRQKMSLDVNRRHSNPTYLTYLITDKLVDSYFPVIYRTEDCLNEINNQEKSRNIGNLIDDIYNIRTDLLRLRHIVNSMKELLYRIISSTHLENIKEYRHNFNDIYDHLLKLSDSIESNREVTGDMRDNYLSIISFKMNKIMTLLTIITSIFIPLTFIVGVYGMNFDYMPELRWKYGYFFVLGIMAAIGLFLLLWFKLKGWLNIKK
ncbi:MAG: magnesium/cobalt transporter CorA [Eubacteriales bacterium]